MNEPRPPIPFDASRVNVLRGKSLVHGLTGQEVRELCFMLDWCEEQLQKDCDTFLPRRVWQSLANALEKSVELQSHYAELLNLWDGGERMTFASGLEWIDRLHQCARDQKKEVCDE